MMNQQEHWAAVLKIMNGQLQPHNTTIKEWHREGKYQRILQSQFQYGEALMSDISHGIHPYTMGINNVQGPSANNKKAQS